MSEEKLTLLPFSSFLFPVNQRFPDTGWQNVVNSRNGVWAGLWV
jgi:hypothetical protein